MIFPKLNLLPISFFNASVTFNLFQKNKSEILLCLWTQCWVKCMGKILPCLWTQCWIKYMGKILPRFWTQCWIKYIGKILACFWSSCWVKYKSKISEYNLAMFLNSMLSSPFCWWNSIRPELFRIFPQLLSGRRLGPLSRSLAWDSLQWETRACGCKDC